MPRNQAMTRSIQAMLESIKAESFSPDYQASDTEAMGLLLSFFFDYDGVDVLKAAEGALEDANYHDAAAQVGEIRTELEGPAKPSVRVFQAPSDTTVGLRYEVTLDGPDGPTCKCADHMYRHNLCKHIRNAMAGVYGKGTRRTVVPR